MDTTKRDTKFGYKERKVFILGLDGATFDLIDPLIEKGELPNLASIINDGVRSKLNSTIPHHSAPAWTSFATGKFPGKHGILGFTRILPNSYKLELVYGSHNRARALWDVLSEKGKKVIVVNIPMTYPPKEVNGILISGLDAPSTNCNFTYPQEIRDEILRVSSDYKINLHLGGYLNTDKRRLKALDIIISAMKARAKVILYLMDKYPWDLFAVRFNSPDNVQHQFWRFMDKTHPLYKEDSPPALKNAIKSVYKELDNVVGRIYENIDKDNTTFLIMSDHGAGPCIGKSIYVNEWLKELGYLSIKRDKSKNGFFAIFHDLSISLKGKMISYLLRTIPPKIKGILMKHVPGAAAKTATYLKFSGIDWSQTKAFVSEVEGIRINLKGRYPEGVVREEDYEPLRRRIIEEAQKLRDPETGQFVFERVCQKEEVYWGDCVEEFPDIILRPDDRYNISPKLSRKRTSGNTIFAREEHWRKISGSHRQYGIFIMKGPDCRHGAHLDKVDITNILPTALYQIGVNLPDDLDGKVIESAFKEEFLKNNPVSVEKTKGYEAQNHADIYTDDDKSKLIDSLRGLGYIE